MLFNQQQCFIYSTASFLSKLRAKKVEKLHNSSFYRNFRKLNTGIGFRNRERLFPVLSIIKKKKKNESRPTDPRFFWHVTVNTHIFFFWPQKKKLREGVMVFNVTFNNISVILVEETQVTGENHWSVVSQNSIKYCLYFKNTYYTLMFQVIITTSLK